MKTPEDEAFDELARKQGAWGGGFPAKRKMTMDKIHAEFYEKYVRYRTAFPKEYAAPQPAQEPVAHPVIAGALYDFMGWLTSRKERIVLSSADNASPAADAIKDFAKMRDLSLDNAQVETWREALAQPEPEMLTIAYQSGYHDGKKAALAGREWNFCERCGKRTADKTVIHTCTPPQGDT